MIKTQTAASGRVFFSNQTMAWHWTKNFQPLTFDECEKLGLDGTLRDR